MSLISDLLIEIRLAIDDMQGSKFSDYLLMQHYNVGNKAMRKIIIDQFPTMLIGTPDTGMTSGQTSTLTKKALRINDIRIDGKKVYKVDLSQVEDKTATGKPTNYQMNNLNTVSWYPIPDKEYPYEVSYIPESTTMDSTMDSGFPSEIETLLVQYVIAKVTGQDTDVTTWITEINNILGNIEPEVTIINGYDSFPSGGGDY